MVGPVPAREEDAARLTGARGDFIGSLGRRVDTLRASLRLVEQSPNDDELSNGLLRRVHALGSAARVLGFASVAEALSEAEKRLGKGEYADFARSLDVLPSLLVGVPVALRPASDARASQVTWPLSVLVFGDQSLADVITTIADTHVECEWTCDLARAREQARLLGPDLAVIDADRPGALELAEALARDPRVDPVPLVVVGDFVQPHSADSYSALGAARVLAKPVAAEILQRTVVELRAQTAEPQNGREPLGDLSVEALADRISAEVRRGLLDAVQPSARATSVGFGEGADVMAAVWGAVARVRELVTLRSSGAVRFDSSGPEGAIPIAPWGAEERRAGERGADEGAGRSAEDVTLQGRRIVVADDDPAVVWFMSGLLRALGVEVLEAHDGARALALTYENWPDLVVSDVLMPKLDGFSLCHEIKRDVAVRDVPVILLSWKEDLLQRVRELGATADGYLRKEAAASTVAERLREVLRPRARVERRIVAPGDARGRLDGLTPRLILELSAAGQRDVRVGIRDAVYLYEVQIRRGRLCSATRSSSNGHFERGPAVLAALLGVSAGRFSVEPDATPCRVDFDGTPAELLKEPIDRARSVLQSISAGALVGVTRVVIATPMIEGYMACTPDPARALLNQLIYGASPRDLITSGEVAPRLLEAVLSDVARRGAITAVERENQDVSPVRASSDSDRPDRRIAPEPARASSSLDAEPNGASQQTTDAGPHVGMPFSGDVTPFGQSASGSERNAAAHLETLEGVGRPEVHERAPAPLSTRPEELDALATALTAVSPLPAAVEPNVTHVMSAVSLPASDAPPSVELAPARGESLSASPPSAASRSVAPSKVSALKAPLNSLPPAPAPRSGWLVKFVIIMSLAFVVAYLLVSYLRTPVPPSASVRPPAPKSSP